MRKLSCSLLICNAIIALACSAKAQIALDFKLESRRFLLNEAMPVTLKIKNMTGELLKFGAGPEEASLKLIAERYKGISLPARDGESPVAGLSLMPGDTHEISFNLNRFVCLSEIGPHQAFASVLWHGKSFDSGYVFFDLHKGVLLRSLTGSVPGEPGKMRTYSLKTLQRAGSECLYLAIGEPEDECLYGLFSLGPYTRTTELETKFDEADNFHLLFKAAGGAFVYAAFTPYGVRLVGEAYKLTPTSTIKLKTRPSGLVEIETVEQRAVSAVTNTFGLPGN